MQKNKTLQTDLAQKKSKNKTMQTGLPQKLQKKVKTILQ